MCAHKWSLILSRLISVNEAFLRIGYRSELIVKVTSNLASFSLLISFTLALLVLTGLGYLSFLVVLTDSMEPTIPRGSLAVAVKTNGYTVGDIILFKVYSRPVLHRIVSVEDGWYRTKGDDNTCRDPWRVPMDAVGCKLITAIPCLGYILWALKKPIYFATFVTLMYATFELRDRKHME